MVARGWEMGGFDYNGIHHEAALLGWQTDLYPDYGGESLYVMNLYIIWIFICLKPYGTVHKKGQVYSMLSLNIKNKSKYNKHSIQSHSYGRTTRTSTWMLVALLHNSVIGNTTGFVPSVFISPGQKP